MMSLDTFLPHLGDTFDVNIGETEPMPIVLIEAAPLRASAPKIRADAFELKFTGPGPAYLNQMIHHLSHVSLGEMDIFLVPIGTHGDGFLYQAVFN